MLISDPLKTISSDEERRMVSAPGLAGDVPRPRPGAGPVGTIARVGVGLLLIGLEFFWRDPKWWDIPVGLLLMPTIVLAAVALWRRRSPQPIRATGLLGHVVNAAVIVPLLLLPATSGGAMLFYGASMLVAGVRRAGGCEVTAISNALLARDDQVGCPLFAPVDIVEAAIHSREALPDKPTRQT